MIQVLFVVIAAAGLAAALGTILARNLVRAALYLIAYFFTVACVFVLLEAEFLAALQVLVYIGAVSIILMFGIMLTRNVTGDDPASTPSTWPMPGLMAGLGVFLVLAFGISFQKGIGGARSWATTDERPMAALGEISVAKAAVINEMGKGVGREMMTRYVVAFEVAGLLLTAALVGAIAIAHREEVEPAAVRGSGRAGREPASGLPFDPTSAAPLAASSSGSPGTH